MNRLEEYRALCARATPGIMRRGTSAICDDGTTAFRAVLEVDAKLFAQARQMGLDLLGEVARLTAERDEWKQIYEASCWEAKKRTRDARDDFMAVVYGQMSGDPDNIRANLIIDAFDNANDHITEGGPADEA